VQQFQKQPYMPLDEVGCLKTRGTTVRAGALLFIFGAFSDWMGPSNLKMLKINMGRACSDETSDISDV
jgi:hypothetical protein